MGEWKDRVIQTGIDKLMEYLRKEREVRVDEAADSLEVDQQTIITWAKSLQKSGLVTIRYTARRGRVIRVVEEGSGPEDVMKEVEDDISESLEQLSDIGREKARLDRFEDVLSRLEEHIEEDENFAEKLRETHPEAKEDLEKLEAFVDDLDSVEDDVAELKEHIGRVKKDIDVISQLDMLQEKTPKKEAVEQSSGKKMSPLYPLKKLVSFLPIGGQGSSASVCEVCGKEFDTEQGIDTHKRLTGHQSEDKYRSGDTEDGETFKCDECDKVFDSLRGIQTHMGMTHDEKYGPMEGEV